jgi:HEAT repeat protein
MAISQSQAQALLPNLASPNANTRLDAAVKLGVPGFYFAVQDLMHCAQNDSDRKVRRAAINSLGKIGDRYAYSLLETIWKNSKEPHDIRDEALKACDRLDGVDAGADDNTSGGGGGRRDDDGLGGI